MSKRISTKKWLSQAVSRTGERPVLYYAYSPDGKRLWTADGYVLFEERQHDYMFPLNVGKFYDVRGEDDEVSDVGRYPDWNVIFPRLSSDAYTHVNALAFWKTLQTLKTGKRRVRDSQFMLKLETDGKTLSVQTSDGVTQYVELTGNPFAKTDSTVKTSYLNFWYVYDAVEGLKHAETIDVHLARESFNVFKTLDRTAIVMHCYMNEQALARWGKSETEKV